MHFCEWKVLYFDLIFNVSQVCSWGANWQQVSIVSGNDLVPTLQRAITRSNTDQAHWHIYAAPRGDELSMQQPYIYVTSMLQCTLGYSLSIYNHKSLLCELITHQQWPAIDDYNDGPDMGWFHLVLPSIIKHRIMTESYLHYWCSWYVVIQRANTSSILFSLIISHMLYIAYDTKNDICCFYKNICQEDKTPTTGYIQIWNLKSSTTVSADDLVSR